MLKDVLPQIAGAMYFTCLDEKSKSWQLELKEESQSLTAMDTMFGHYLWQEITLWVVLLLGPLQHQASKALPAIMTIV